MAGRQGVRFLYILHGVWVTEIELAIGFQATGLWSDLVEEQGRVGGEAYYLLKAGDCNARAAKSTSSL